MNLDTQFWIQLVVYAVSFAFAWGNVTTRLKYLEEKMDKHNNMQERLVIVEQRSKSAHHRIDEIKTEMDERENT